MVVFGIDVARGGKDCSVIFIREDLRALEIVKSDNSDTMHLAGLIQIFHRKYIADEIRIDVIGPGGPVFDRLRELGLPVVEFNGAEKTDRTDSTGLQRFQNMRSYSWYHLREILDPHSDVQIDLIRDDDLLGDLCAPRYKVNSDKGRIEVEKKNDFKKRLGRSPDVGDAGAMAFCDAEPSVYVDQYRPVVADLSRPEAKSPAISSEERMNQIWFGGAHRNTDFFGGS